jgi:hypothetical protein
MFPQPWRDIVTDVIWPDDGGLNIFRPSVEFTNSAKALLVRDWEKKDRNMKEYFM